MAVDNTASSVGVVRTQVAEIALPPDGFRLESGQTLPELTIDFETYGTLSDEGDNAVFICHALSGDAHVAGYHEDKGREPGWWDEMIGPGKGIDTTYYCVICANILGGCEGTTGPASINPATGQAYGSTFPRITVGDIVNAHRLLLQHLGIARLAAIVGGSFGGMQVLEWAIRHPDSVERCICIASALGLSAQALAFDIVGRQAIMSDPHWHDGDYYRTGSVPAHGLAQARQIGHITYLSPGMMDRKFGRERVPEGPDPQEGGGTAAAGKPFRSRFQVESYLEHQGAKFVQRFDANSYLHITWAMDEFDLTNRYGSLDEAFARISARFLVVALSADWLFPPEQSIEIVRALVCAGKRASYCQLRAPHGHDAFLVDIDHLAEAIRAFLPWVSDGSRPSLSVTSREEDPDRLPRSPIHREEFVIIRDMIRPGSRVLDLGCGNGELLSMLTEQRRVAGFGVDIDLQSVIEVIDHGLDILQADIDSGLVNVPDHSFDYAVLSETLQVIHRPRGVLREMLRVANEGIVSFPNFGNWSRRVSFWRRGQITTTDHRGGSWFDSPAVHLFTPDDFADLCSRDGIRILEMVCIPTGHIGKLLTRVGRSNLGADRILVRVARG